MLKHKYYITIAVFLICASVSFAHTHNWSLGVKSSYFGDQTNRNYRLTSTEDQMSFGFRLRYFPQDDLAIQFSGESLKGTVRNNSGDELNFQTSVAALVYPFNIWKLSPYFSTGFVWVQANRNVDAQSDSDLNLYSGIGFDIALYGNLVYTADYRVYSDGFGYLGWGTSFGFGYRF